MGVSLMVIAGALAALSNYCMRRSIDVGGSAKAFFVFQLFCTFVVTACVYPTTMPCTWDFPLIALAVAGGIALGMMKIALDRALQKGPAGLTFATVNSACVIPAMVIALFLSRFIECDYNIWNGIGTLCVVGGLMWAGGSYSGFCSQSRLSWALLAWGAFLFQSLFLIATEGRLALIEWGCQNTAWFVPMIFFSAGCFHAIRFTLSERRIPGKQELVWGVYGGVINGVCTFFFIWGSEIATGMERAIIFPVFSIALIVSCNLWGQFFYRERVNWLANTLCLLGILISAV